MQLLQFDQVNSFLCFHVHQEDPIAFMVHCNSKRKVVVVVAGQQLHIPTGKDTSNWLIVDIADVLPSKKDSLMRYGFRLCFGIEERISVNLNSTHEGQVV